MDRLIKLAVRVVCGACALSACAVALAQGYPTKAIRWIVPYPPGGGTDVISRALAPHLQANLGQPVVIDNRPSATGFIGIEAVARSAPDGYMMLTSGNELVMMKTMYRNLTFDPQRDLAAVAIMVTVPIALFVHESVPAKTVKELIAYAKSQPGKINFGSPGVGHGFHLAMEMFLSYTGTQMTHIPYKGSALVMQDLFSGRIQATMYPADSRYVAQVKKGELRALAAGVGKRLAALPEVPTFEEAGVANYNADGFNSVTVRSGTPRDIIERLSREIRTALVTPDLAKTIEALSVLPNTMNAEQAQDFMNHQVEAWSKVIKSLGLVLD